jgi:hypothetical protein
VTKSETRHAPHAWRTGVEVPDVLVGAEYDYADAFEIQLPEGETRSPEQMFRAALDDASWVQRWVPVVHRQVIRFRLGPRSSPDHLLGWRIVSSDADVIHLEADGPLMRGVIVGRRTSRSTGVFTTFVFFRKRTAARMLWPIIGPLHRRVAPYLLERGVTTASPPLQRG